MKRKRGDAGAFHIQMTGHWGIQRLADRLRYHVYAGHAKLMREVWGMLELDHESTASLKKASNSALMWAATDIETRYKASVVCCPIAVEGN